MAQGQARRGRTANVGRGRQKVDGRETAKSSRTVHAWLLHGARRINFAAYIDGDEPCLARFIAGELQQILVADCGCAQCVRDRAPFYSSPTDTTWTPTVA